MSCRAALCSVRSRVYRWRAHSLSKVSLAEMICSDSRADDMSVDCHGWGLVKIGSIS